jgi:hypothetical protein
MKVKNTFLKNFRRNYVAFTIIPTISIRYQNTDYWYKYSILVTWLFWSNLWEFITEIEE